MWTLRDLVLVVELPMQIKWPRMALTAGLNTCATVINATVTVALSWWAAII